MILQRVIHINPNSMLVSSLDVVMFSASHWGSLNLSLKFAYQAKSFFCRSNAFLYLLSLQQASNLNNKHSTFVTSPVNYCFDIPWMPLNKRSIHWHQSQKMKVECSVSIKFLSNVIFCFWLTCSVCSFIFWWKMNNDEKLIKRVRHYLVLYDLSSIKYMDTVFINDIGRINCKNIKLDGKILDY